MFRNLVSSKLNNALPRFGGSPPAASRWQSCTWPLSVWPLSVWPLSVWLPLGRMTAFAMLLLLVIGDVAAAADADWPVFPQFARGPGGYFAWYKLLLLWLLFLLWVKTTDWVNRDVQLVRMSYATWNPLVFFPFIVVLLTLGLGLPLFRIGFPLTLAALGVPLTVYVLKRNAKVQPHERVMTVPHIRYLIARMFGKASAGDFAEPKAAHEQGVQVDLAGRGSGDAQKDQANTILARQMPGFVTAKELIAGAIDNRAEKAMLDYARESVSLRYQVDGVWHDGDEQELESATAALGILKKLANADPAERKARQEGVFEASYKGEKFTCPLISQGTKTGERVIVHLEGIGSPFKSLDELGMREGMIERFKDLMLADNGFLVLSAVPSGGLSTLLNMALRSTDRYLRDFILVENVKDPAEEVENITPAMFNPAAGETPDKILPNVMRREPDVLVLPELHNRETVGMLCEGAVEDQLIIATVRAKEAVEALLRVLLLKVPAKSFAPVVIGVLNQRMIRKLCESCKEAYEPPAALLKKLGIPPNRVQQLFRHPEEPEEVCPECRGIGYKGRTAIFELLAVDDNIREALVKQPKLDVLRKVARQSGHRSLQEEGILAVVRGITSLPELMRVLKQ